MEAQVNSIPYKGRNKGAMRFKIILAVMLTVFGVYCLSLTMQKKVSPLEQDLAKIAEQQITASVKYHEAEQNLAFYQAEKNEAKKVLDDLDVQYKTKMGLLGKEPEKETDKLKVLKVSSGQIAELLKK